MWHRCLVTDPETPTDADLTRLVDDARGDDAVRQRSRQRWLQQQALEEARLSGVLLAAAEERQSVVLRATSGRSHIGLVAAVGKDFCVIVTASGTQTFVRLSAVVLVQPDAALQPVPAADARHAPLDLTLHEALAGRAPERPDVAVVSLGQPDAVVGRLVAVGTDVATLEIDERRRVAYLSLPSVTEVAFLASG